MFIKGICKFLATMQKMAVVQVLEDFGYNASMHDSWNSLLLLSHLVEQIAPLHEGRARREER